MNNFRTHGHFLSNHSSAFHHRTLLMINQPSGIDRAMRQQDITWANVDPDLCHHMISIGHNYLFCSTSAINTLRPRQNGWHFPDDIFKWIFLNENVWISISISLKFVPRGPINNIPTLVQVMAWRRPGDKPLSEPMMVRLPTHICITRPQWVKGKCSEICGDLLSLRINPDHRKSN